MSNKQFFNNLSATYADVRRLDAKKINLKGKNILEYIKENKTEINDLRKGQVSSNDIWKNGLQIEEDESLTIYPIGYNKINYEEFTDEQRSHYWNNIAKVEDYVCYDVNNEVSCHLDTTSLVLGSNAIILFYESNQMHPEPYFDCTGSSDGKTLNGLFGWNENIVKFNSDLSNMENGAYFFAECPNFTYFNSDLSSLIYGYHMFDYCTKMDIFNCKSLNSLKEGICMFYGCEKLTSFELDLPKLIDGRYMFDSCRKLATFTTKDLSSLENGNSMFCLCPFSSFNADLKKLIDGGGMFHGCINLTSFNSSLDSLVDAVDMFTECKLDTTSIANIILSLPQRESMPSSTSSHGDGIIDIGIGIPNTEDAKEAFANEAFYESWADLNQEFVDRNWRVDWQFNGEAATFDLRSPRPSTAVYAKLEEVIMPTENDTPKPHYKYTSVDGTKFYNIHWYHESNMEDESYTLFDSLEAAIESYNIIPKI